MSCFPWHHYHIGVNATILHTGSSFSFWSNHHLFTLFLSICVYEYLKLPWPSLVLFSQHILYVGSSRNSFSIIFLASNHSWFPPAHRWPLLLTVYLLVAGLCWLTVGFVAVAPQVSALCGLTLLHRTAADEAPPTPSSRKARVQGASPTTKSNRPTHSLPQIWSSTPPHTPTPPSSVDWTSLWVTMKFWSMSIAEQIKKRKWGFKWLINQQPISGSVLLCFNYSGWGISIGSEWHPIISCCKIGVNWINLMSWSLIKIPLSWCQGEFNGGCPYLYVVLTCEWWFLHGLPLRNGFHSSSTCQEKKFIHYTWYMSDKSNSERNTLLRWQKSSFFHQLQSNL